MPPCSIYLSSQIYFPGDQMLLICIFKEYFLMNVLMEIKSSSSLLGLHENPWGQVAIGTEADKTLNFACS